METTSQGGSGSQPVIYYVGTWNLINAVEPSVILGAKGTCIVWTRHVTETTLRVAPGNPLVLNTEVGTVIPCSGIGMKITFDIPNTHVTITCNDF